MCWTVNENLENSQLNHTPCAWWNVWKQQNEISCRFFLWCFRVCILPCSFDSPNPLDSHGHALFLLLLYSHFVWSYHLLWHICWSPSPVLSSLITIDDWWILCCHSVLSIQVCIGISVGLTPSCCSVYICLSEDQQPLCCAY